MVNRKYKRLEGESDEELIYRICSQKAEIGTWRDVADILNELTGAEFGESAYRKQYQSFSKMFESNQSLFTDSQDLLEQIKQQRRELEKEKIKFRDERNEYNKLIRDEARKESYKDLVVRTMQEHAPLVETIAPKKTKRSENDLIVHCTDIHAGIEIDNWFNSFNEDIMIERFENYLGEIQEIQERHDSENCYLIIGEVISGLIHENLRCENNQNLIEQFLSVTDCLAQFIAGLAKMFNEVHVYVTPGNHSRISPKKEQNLKGENFDNLLIPYLSARLQNIPSVIFHKNQIEESVAIFSVRGNTVFAAHGDKDDAHNAVHKLSLLFNMIPKFVFLGHRHRNGLTTINDTKVIESGSMSGVDNYALDIRFKTCPEQTVSVVNEDGLVCLYDIQL